MSEFTSEITVVEVSQQPIELCKLLKIANMVGGGGEAKIVISEGYVALNGEVEFQKRKKVYHEDVVEFNGEVIQLLVNESLVESAAAAPKPLKPENPQSNSKKSKASSANKKQKKNNKLSSSNENRRQNPDQKKIGQQNIEEQTSGRKRRPISF